ncbi:M42 family metallopeptidase [Halanaerobacter jeridensis]|uniref:Endoglucanase n=1 Tax=Halanaerobacter jeridensis TaxID=706427 RepID=A0A939BS40_9FIRM|nr:M42 family metallopeptidase [Halanaerobacter jeridensis]MBM7556716.1 endoglucanase [Halanaerobacter jeridensis]
MNDNVEILKQLSETNGVSGHEKNITTQVEDILKEYTDEIKYDNLGNLIACKKGSEQDGPKVMFAAHMDEIGLMISDIEDEGFLRFTSVGGVDQRTLVGQEVTVLGQEELQGIIGAKPPHVQSANERRKAYKMDDMYIDLGLEAEEVKEKVRIGDVVTVKREFEELKNNRVTGKALDDRAGILVMLTALQELKNIDHKADLYTVATVQEEVGVRGATTSTYGIVPDIGIAIDVCHGTMPGVSSEDAAELGGGSAIGFGPHVHPKMFSKLKDIAEKNEIKYQVEPSHTPRGTDAFAIQVTRAGIPTALISIPLRYMHTSVETISMKDIKRSGKLLARFIRELNDEFVEGLQCF